MQEYIEESYKLSIQARHEEDEDEEISRYVNGLCFVIKDEISLHKLSSGDEVY